MQEPEIDQVLELIESSREATNYIYSSTNLIEKETLRSLLANAMRVIQDILRKYNISKTCVTEKFLQCLNEESNNQAIIILNEIESYIEQIRTIEDWRSISIKYGVLKAYPLLDALYLKDLYGAKVLINSLMNWFVDNHNMAISEACLSLYAQLEKVFMLSYASLRDYNTLCEPLLCVLQEWIDTVGIRLYHSSRSDNLTKSLCLIESKDNRCNKYKNISINILLAISGSDTEISDEVDLIFSAESIVKRAYFCYPLDLFDYDRLYLSSKLQSLTENSNVSIILGGSSYAMVGFKETLMPCSAVNLAVNAQDPYYTFLSVKAAKRACNKINVAIITGGYYFWHTDMSDEPSDYYRSVITRVNYPVFSDFHNYKGESVEPMKRTHFDPLLEKVFDFRLICENRNNDICNNLKDLPYYNDEINKRPANGMLNFSFRTQTDSINDNAAKVRAEAHNGNYNLNRLNSNMDLFYKFLMNMNAEQVKIMVLIPPVTTFYRRHISSRLRDSSIVGLKKIQDKIYFTLSDLTDCPDYNNNDFQDYDHLNDNGAVKLSSYIATCINKQEEWSI